MMQKMTRLVSLSHIFCYVPAPHIHLDLTFIVNTVKPVHTGMAWGQSFIPVWPASGLDKVFAF